MPPRILIVDDDHTLADVLSVALRRAGFDARVAYDGPRALQILHQEPFDLVLLDVIMPNMDGLEVCKRIRSDPQIAHVLVLLFTALTLRAEMRDARKSGADGFISKPAVVREVVLRIQALLARGQTGRETLGPIVAFVGVKGGVGASTVALNVALGLVSEGYRTLLLDLGGPGLTSAWVLGLEPTRFLLDLANAKAMSITMPDLQNCTLTHVTGLRYIPGHAQSAAISNLARRSVANALDLMRELYDMIVLDVDPSNVPIWKQALGRATTILAVADQDPLCLRHMRALESALEEIEARNLMPGYVLVERYPAPNREAYLSAAHEQGFEALALVPTAFQELHEANSRPAPLAFTHPDCMASLAMRELARLIAGRAPTRG